MRIRSNAQLFFLSVFVGFILALPKMADGQGQVRGVDIRDSTITSVDLADGAVTATKTAATVAKYADTTPNFTGNLRVGTGTPGFATVAGSLYVHSITELANAVYMPALTDNKLLWVDAAGQIKVITLGTGFSLNTTTGELTFTETGTGTGNLSGTLSADRIPYATGANTLADDSGLVWDATNDRLGIGTTSPLYAISLGGETSRTLGMGRRTTADTIGQDFVIVGGGAATGGTNRAGGSLILAPGQSTGSAGGAVYLNAPVPGGSGTSDTAYTNIARVNESGTLFYKQIGVGTAVLTNAQLALFGLGALSGTTQYGIFNTPTLTTAATLAINGVYSAPVAGVSATNAYAFNAASSAGTGTITNWYGYYSNPTHGTNKYAFATPINVDGTAAWAFRATGTAPSRFDGSVGIKMNPTNDLDVTGTIGATGTITANQMKLGNAGLYVSSSARGQIVPAAQTGGGAIPWRIRSGDTGGPYTGGSITHEIDSVVRTTTDSTGLTVDGYATSQRLRSNGTAFAGVTDVSTTGWGTGATSVVQTGSTDTAGSVTVTCGTGPSANPTIVLTWQNGAYLNTTAASQAPFMTASWDTGSTGAAAQIGTATTATTGTLTYLGTPVDTSTYKITWHTIGGR
jgi:hypothetical protein